MMRNNSSHNSIITCYCVKMMLFQFQRNSFDHAVELNYHVCIILQVCNSRDYSGIRLQLLALRPQDCQGAKHQITMTTTPGSIRKHQETTEQKQRTGAGDAHQPWKKSHGQMDDRQEL